MQAITFNQAIQNFANFMDEVSDNHEPLIITHENHKAVVLISLEAEVSPENIIKQQAFDFARSQYIQHSRKVVMPAGMPASSHKDVTL
ncbi:MAG: type II toxin-antitoxin system Phd/YefM family antitoxin [Methylococcaceae bacterium]